MKKYIFLTFVLIFFIAEQSVIGQENTFEKILNSLTAEKGIISAERSYNTALLNQKYNYLQWWNPHVVIGNDLIYPYKKDTFDDLATSNTNSLTFALPLLTGTVINLSAGYSLNRNMTDSLVWGFSQNLQGKIGIEQSLNPWWLHTRNNPYKSGAALQANIAMTDYNIAIKNILYSTVRGYIELRKAERTIAMLIEKIDFYDDIISSYRQNLQTGQISLNELQDFRREKWEHEQTLFSLEQNIAALKNELFQNTGIAISNISSEELINIDNDILMNIFLGTGKNYITRLEQHSVELQKRSLLYERLLHNQNSAPSIKIDFGSSFLLPVQETSNLNDAWDEKNFTDNELNNWSIGVSVDFSNLLSPMNKKKEQERMIMENALHLLSNKIETEKEIEKNQNREIIQLLETHIAQLTEMVKNDYALNEDMQLLFERGDLSELEYRQSLITNSEKRLLLDNFHDDLWLHRFLRKFYHTEEK